VTARALLACGLLATAAGSGCAGPSAALPHGESAVGLATYYGREFAGRRTASGEIYDPELLTAAHRTLAFGSRVRVTNLVNGRHVVVRINDRGPTSGDRLIDLSHRAAKQLHMLQAGVVRVRLELVGGGKPGG
jgi:rare lipoprotein A